MCELNIAKSAEEIALAVIAQNNEILCRMQHPLSQTSVGIYEDPHGQPICVDKCGNSHCIHSGKGLNGWTV